MDKTFVPAEEAYRKLHFSRGMNMPVYLYGATGYGKTMLLRQYLQDANVLWFSAENGEWDLEAVNQASKENLCVVLDDLHLLIDEERRGQVVRLAQRTDLWLVLIGRMPTPHWLLPLLTQCRLGIIQEEALYLREKEISKIASNQNIHLTHEQLKYLEEKTMGNAVALSMTLQYIKSGSSLDEALTEKISTFFADYLESQVICRWNIAVQEFLMMICVVDSFTLPLAETITGDDQAAAMLEQSMNVGNFITQTGEVYIIRPVLLVALRSRMRKVMGSGKYRECAYRAGLYYEMQDDVVSALKMYEISNNPENIRSLLIRNGRRHPGMGHYYELRRYYLALDPRDIETSPVLMSALSLLYSILMNPEQSEYWYAQLKVYAAKAKGGDRQEAKSRLLWLDVVLPHRGSLDMIDILKHGTILLRSGEYKLPEISVTSKLPSTMNGGKDFCHWSKHDQQIADTIGVMIERFLGKFGRGLVGAALGESFYEKGGRDYDVLYHLTKSQAEIVGGGDLEIQFACVGIQCRMSYLMGNISNSFQLLDGFEKRVIEQNDLVFLPNIRALRCRLNLLAGKMKEVSAWMQEAPDEAVDFFTMDRYRYLTKVRCYIAYGEQQKAATLLGMIWHYAEVSKRLYIQMETNMLLSIVLERQNEDWKPTMLKLLHSAAEFQFIRLISEEGNAILPLLKQIRKTYLESDGADAKWFDRLLKETQNVANRYSGYLSNSAATRADFSEMALAVLRLQSEGKNAAQIAQALCLTERTVKYHASENYRKLGVKGKTEAVQKARSLNLL